MNRYCYCGKKAKWYVKGEFLCNRHCGLNKWGKFISMFANFVYKFYFEPWECKGE